MNSESDTGKMSGEAATTPSASAVTAAMLSHDELWPRAGGWPTLTGTDSTGGAGTDGTGADDADADGAAAHHDVTVVGVPTSKTSLSPTNAHETPAAIREALRRCSTHLVAAGSRAHRGSEAEIVLDEALSIIDAGDVIDPDTEAGEQIAAQRIASLSARSELVVALGGDNACTVPAALGVAMAHGGLAGAGLITLDAHHDLRDGRSNGSPVRRLIEMGLNPRHVVQIGIADFANSQAYRQRAKDLGITVIHRDELHDRSLTDVAAEALAIAGAGGGPIHVDLDVDVCDRSVAPGCPASVPGGLQAHELRRIARLLTADTRVRGLDIAEVDATADAPDARTVRLAALLVLEAAAGVALRA